MGEVSERPESTGQHDMGQAPKTPGKPEGTKPPEPKDVTISTRMSKKQEHTWGMLCHLIAFTGYITAIGFIIGPLVIWLLKRNESPFVDDQGKESLNFQITMLIYWVISAILSLIIIGFVLMSALAVFHIVMVIVASVRASNGERFRYPITLRFIK